jgi:SAM-dependent methyltransferase
MNDKHQCPLCQSNQVGEYLRDTQFIGGRRDYFSCNQCALIFVTPNCHLSTSEERARYTTHKNSPQDVGYVKFLKQLTDPLKAHLHSESCGLDYGCGPGPAIDAIYKEEDIKVFNYDPYFKNDKALLNKTYDFVVCTEVFEHLRNPYEDIKRITNLVKPGGFIGVMTLLYKDEEDFKTWWYRKDNTHIMFYTKKTFQWINKHFNLEVLKIEARVVIFQKNKP